MLITNQEEATLISVKGILYYILIYINLHDHHSLYYRCHITTTPHILAFGLDSKHFKACLYHMATSMRQYSQENINSLLKHQTVRGVDLQVSVAYLMCSPLQVLMKSCTWEKSVSKSGMFGMENFTNLE